MDPADEHERACWKIKLLPKDLDCSDLEDWEGHYRVLGCSKASSDEAIADRWRKLNRSFKELARTHHPDKAGDDAAKVATYMEASDRHDLQKKAMDILGQANEAGAFEARFKYDDEGEDLRNIFLEKFKIAFNGKSYAEHLSETAALKQASNDRDKIYAKVAETRAKTQSSVDLVIKHYNKTGHQDNHSS